MRHDFLTGTVGLAGAAGGIAMVVMYVMHHKDLDSICSGSGAASGCSLLSTTLYLSIAITVISVLWLVFVIWVVCKTNGMDSDVAENISYNSRMYRESRRL